MKKYKVHVQTIMEADVYVDAENEQDAYDIVDENVFPFDRLDGSCEFDFGSHFPSALDEIRNNTCKHSETEICSIEETEANYDD